MLVFGLRRTAAVRLWLLGEALLFACGGQGKEGEPAADGPEASALSPSGPGVAARGAPSNRFAVCPTPLGSAEELALTPRADTNLELLALTLDTGRLTATQATYERVVADVEAIRASAPSLASLAFWPPHDGHTLAITFGSDAMDAFGAGTYTAWDCLLEAYRAEIGGVIDTFPTYAPTLYLDGIFDMPRLAELFGQLPDVSVEINDTAGRRTLCARREGERYEYVVDRSNGSCDSTSACTGSARHFSSDAAGEVTVGEIWFAGEEPAPDWFRETCE
ncbi:MAG: hypothetical protein RL685_669 [Pseudomonadota bacterium]|jgi:hypothetical protein